MGNFYEIIGSAIAKKDPVWGWHLLVDCKSCDKSTINSEDTIKSFLNILVNRIKMIPVGDVISYVFNDGNGRGISGLRLLTSSHCSVHSDDNLMSAYIDVFSCNKYDKEIVDIAVTTIKEYFNPKDFSVKIILREPGKITNA
jgi:S-adenosylmethionine/arginine decarboxylase-like enzyme